MILLPQLFTIRFAGVNECGSILLGRKYRRERFTDGATSIYGLFYEGQMRPRRPDNDEKNHAHKLVRGTGFEPLASAFGESGH